MKALTQWAAAGALFGLAMLGCSSAETGWNGEVVELRDGALRLTGTNWDGRPFELDEVQGKVAVVFFGYTFCPDICPFTLAKMKQIYAQLGDQADEVAMIFASVDPERDTVEKLSRYVPNFDRRFYGLRLEPEQITEVDEVFDLTVQYGQPKEGPGTDSFYYVDHTGTYFILDRQGRLRLKFPPNAKVEDMVPDLKTLLAE